MAIEAKFAKPASAKVTTTTVWLERFFKSRPTDQRRTDLAPVGGDEKGARQDGRKAEQSAKIAHFGGVLPRCSLE